MLHGLIPSNPSNFGLDSIPSLDGKVALVTGGNTGIGFETVLQMARKQCKVYLGARSREKAEAAIAKMKEADSTVDVVFVQMDLQDLASVKKAAADFSSKEDHLDILVNNAGIMASPFALSKDGVEAQFATNHLGHFFLTTSLIPKLLKSKETPRVVNVSSVAHLAAPSVGIYSLEEMNDSNTMNNGTRYGQSKLANILFSKGLNERYGDKIICNSLHPGWVNTELIRGIYENSTIIGKISWLGNQLLAISPLKGAMTSLYLATSPEIAQKDIRDKYYVPLAEPIEPHNLAKSAELSDKLWTMSENILRDKGFL